MAKNIEPNCCLTAFNGADPSMQLSLMTTGGEHRFRFSVREWRATRRSSSPRDPPQKSPDLAKQRCPSDGTVSPDRLLKWIRRRTSLRGY
ncbi:hypothetical protein AVEN_143696-1 [Araneus ventricosus]|uniref:Uncharacterized protein n=1 Tax=Araneus ventricosus TaxID=182803 RepID=A0A4Y2AQD3_ARAVE|nr:hypothetical protein AVEN_143696-1 [Araneus ventricosus]